MSRFTKFKLHFAVSLIIFFVSLILLKIVDIVAPSPRRALDFLFPPHQKVIYKTSEFYSLASINKFGFRGEETALKKGQVLVVGDSFTFGFGNNNNEVWPFQLQEKIRPSGASVDVYNLGVPGTDTIFHINTAKSYVEKLEPSILILSVLISDDFQQVHESGQISNSEKSFSEYVKGSLRIFYPIIYDYYTLERSARSLSNDPSDIPVVTAQWREQSLKYLSDHKLSYPDDIKARIEVGDINPGLLYLARQYPDRAWSFWKNLTVSGSSELATLLKIESELLSLRDLVVKKGGRLYIFSMPSGAFVRSKVFGNYRKYGFTSSENILTSFEPEVALAALSAKVGAEFIPSLDYFRGVSGEELFFPYDGHLTSFGNLQVARLLHGAIFDRDSIN